MTNLKREALALIESIPDERRDVLLKIVKGIRELVDTDSQDDIYSAVEHDLAIIEEMENLIGEESEAHG